MEGKKMSDKEFIGMLAYFSDENFYFYWFEPHQNIWDEVERIVRLHDSHRQLPKEDIYTVIEF